jgi:tRNA pseudouridine55 synthase
MNGLLLIDKPSGWTSFDVVNYVRKIIATAEGVPPKRIKVGHTGTLDPLATGLVVLVIGEYCKRAGEFSKLNKSYDVAIRLGETSRTGDEEGEKTVVSDFEPSSEDVLTAVDDFIGEISQVPPAYSAVKVNGVRAYKLARSGATVELQPRTVHIYSIKDIIYAYPELRFTADVSSGTYIRSLATDIGESLKTGAYMTALRRTSVGMFQLSDAVELDGINIDIISSNLRTIPA